MTQTTACFAGIDISKETLDLAFSNDSRVVRSAITKTAGRKLVVHLTEREPERIVFEATGPYHRDLETALCAACLVYAKANPRKMRRFADVIGVHSKKIDRVDAKQLARFPAVVATMPAM